MSIKYISIKIIYATKFVKNISTFHKKSSYVLRGRGLRCPLLYRFNETCILLSKRLIFIEYENIFVTFHRSVHFDADCSKVFHLL